MILLTKSSVPIIGQVASIMGWIMDGIYKMFLIVWWVFRTWVFVSLFSVLLFLCTDDTIAG